MFDEGENKALHDKAERLRGEYVVCVRGAVRRRSEDTVNTAQPTGMIEVRAAELRILSAAETPPFEIEENSRTNEKVRLKYRYLDLRRPDMQRNIMLRHKVAKLTRDYFDSQGFLEIETPMLIKSSPEGARDYIVPSRVHPGLLLRPAPVAAAVQTAADALRLRSLYADRALLPRRGPARRQTA